MPDAVVTAEVASAVVAMLEAATLSQRVTPERSYADWESPLEDDENCPQGKLLVDVVANTTGQKCELASRGSYRYTIPIDIAIRKRFATDKQSDDTGRISIDSLDAMALLTQEVHELFQPQRLTDFDSGVWLETKILASPLTKHLVGMRQWTSVVQVTFTVNKAIS